MGYLDKTSITVDAILTKRGRELLARNDGSFAITQFALGDDEIDYTLFNENHPNGTQYSSEAIENIPLIEAMPDGANMLQSRLITLRRGTSAIPYIKIANQNGIELVKGTTITIAPQTYNVSGNNLASYEPGGYRFTIVDNRLRHEFMADQQQTKVPVGATYSPATVTSYTTLSNTAAQETITARSATIRATQNDALFTTTLTSLTTSIIIEGVTTGARLTVPFTVTTT